jgi:hypothetical protein
MTLAPHCVGAVQVRISVFICVAQEILRGVYPELAHPGRAERAGVEAFRMTLTVFGQKRNKSS